MSNSKPRRRTYIISSQVTLTVVEDSRDQSRDRVDADLADVVRTLLGPIVQGLDLPRIHVMAEGHRVLLHGDVASTSDAHTLERVVRGFPGVHEVESHLHIGLLPSDTRPSAADEVDSPMLARLLGEASSIGLIGSEQIYAVRGTVGAILDQIPETERVHVLAHIPHDVRELIDPAQRRLPTRHWRDPESVELAAAIRSGITADAAAELTPRMIAVLREFVPEEDHDVQATLSHRLRDYWTAADTSTRDVRA